MNVGMQHYLGAQVPQSTALFHTPWLLLVNLPVLPPQKISSRKSEPKYKIQKTEILQITEPGTRGLKRPRYQGVGISLRRLSPDSIRKTRSSPHCTGPSIVNTNTKYSTKYKIQCTFHWEAFWFKQTTTQSNTVVLYFPQKQGVFCEYYTNLPVQTRLARRFKQIAHILPALS